jgi:hypothetical protein
MLKPLENDDDAPPSCVSAPVLEIEKSVVVEFAVEDDTSNAVRRVPPLLRAIPNRAVGDVVPMPMVPEVGRRNAVVVAGMVPKMRLPMLICPYAVADGKKMLLPSPIALLPVVKLFAS